MYKAVIWLVSALPPAGLETEEWQGQTGSREERMQNRTGLILCALSLLTGFLMICLGGFFISNSIFHSQRNLVVAYVLLPMGFVILLSGIFWGTYRQANENKEMFNHVLRQHLAFQDLPLATVDRYVLSTGGHEKGREESQCGKESEAQPHSRSTYRREATQLGLKLHHWAIYSEAVVHGWGAGLPLRKTEVREFS